MLLKEITPLTSEKQEKAVSRNYNSSLPCWEIMGCDSSKECPAKENPDLPCWEIASAMDDHRKWFNVCEDCIVRVLKTSSITICS